MVQYTGPTTGNRVESRVKGETRFESFIISEKVLEDDFTHDDFIRLWPKLRGVMSRGYCCFRSILRRNHYLVSTHAQNSPPVELLMSYQNISSWCTNHNNFGGMLFAGIVALKSGRVGQKKL